jgi:hypothetical protein
MACLAPACRSRDVSSTIDGRALSAAYPNPERKARVVIFAPRTDAKSAPFKFAVMHRITLNGNELGVISANNFVAALTDAGKVTITGRGEAMSEITFDAEPERIYYVWAGPRKGRRYSNVAFELAPAQKAEGVIAGFEDVTRVP